MILLTFASLVVAILNLKNKPSCTLAKFGNGLLFM